MKTKLLALIGGFIFTSLQAQTTHMLDWRIGSVSPTTDLTINVGDTVEWTWTDGAPHTVQSGLGAAEFFNSGQLTGIGQKYSYTFTVAGVNPYLCGVHGAGNMSGTITVQNILGLNDVEQHKFRISPNPARNKLNLEISRLGNVSVAVFDVLGKKIYADRIENLNKSIDVSNWNNGLYLVKLASDSGTQTKRFVKQ